MKFCKKCQVETEKNTRGECKPCKAASDKAYKAANRDAVAARRKARYEANREAAAASCKAYRAANSAVVAVRKKAYYEANREAVAAYQKAWRKKNSLVIIERVKAWAAANPNAVAEHKKAYRESNRDKFKVYSHNRRARESCGKLSTDLEKRLLILQRGKCACCKLPLGDDYQLDHIMPIALGGSNTDDNIQLLRSTCNLQKHTKHPIDFMQSRGFLL